MPRVRQRVRFSEGGCLKNNLSPGLPGRQACPPWRPAADLEINYADCSCREGAHHQSPRIHPAALPPSQPGSKEPPSSSGRRVLASSQPHPPGALVGVGGAVSADPGGPRRTPPRKSSLVPVVTPSLPFSEVHGDVPTHSGWAAPAAGPARPRLIFAFCWCSCRSRNFLHQSFRDGDSDPRLPPASLFLQAWCLRYE